MVRLYFVIILYLNHLNIIKADLSNPLISDYEEPNCEANKTYKAENITCICTEKGEWPNDDCYFQFEKLNSYDQTCEPEKFVFIDCNVCRCGHDGKIDKEQCTQRKCKTDKKFRRSNTIKSTCKPKKWYSFAPCRICYCVNKHKLICNNENKSSKISLQNEYKLSECGNDMLLDMKELVSEKKAIRQQNREEIVENSSDESERLETLEIDKETTVKYNRPKVNKHKAKNKLIHEVNNKSKSVKRKIKKSKLSKGTKDKTMKDVSDNINSSRIDVSSVLDNILNLVFRKSLVSINSGNKCKPGSTTRVGCNSCFCLTNALKEKLYSERCKKNSIVLNDCNWCWCDTNQRYQCKARVCEEIDMFGHFKDAIQEIDVGMEGHGSWRSRPTSCSPGVHYRRGGVLCVCDENGNWPNPVCRDLFRVLHSVELTGKTKISHNESCVSNKLHLVGCNVCFCPSTGVLDPNLCTKKDCDEGDPVLEAKDGTTRISDLSKVNDLEIYATCNPKSRYELGCMNCNCIGNNRLLCDNCTSKSKEYTNILKTGKLKNKFKSYCTGKKPGKIFKIGCNSCHCDENASLLCTAKKCITPYNVNLMSGFRFSNSIKFKKVKAPPDDQSCISGTQYQRGCNTCTCVKHQNDIKVVDCTLKNCKKTNPIDDQKEDCLEKSYYELDCKLCYCYKKSGVKHQVCQIRQDCFRNLVDNENPLQATRLQSVKNLHGYCEPLHRYRNNCNLCRCLSDGKTLMCGSKVCIKRSSENLTVDIVPVLMKNSELCPKGHSYKLNCNLCFCLSNGNAICTTNDCSKL
ncbi:unnamed protein product [Euphydryas editha]|uniref:Pacifastin domain-containing protein n=1 Tax=Euphydryas editha TaxID=104508 RepID=A0AAU9UEK2_EUPED|nr:unnamed protein product [Euphydryas editha]